MKIRCCQCNQESLEECENDAVWEIRDIDNPNTLENDTYSCNSHLAEMLTVHNSVTIL